MLIDFRTLFAKYNIQAKGVIQVGSHWAEEHEIFMELGVEKLVYIEPCEEAFDVLRSKFRANENVELHNVACGAKEGEYRMYVAHANQGQSNSLLKPHLHLKQHPEVKFTDSELVQVVLLDEVMKNKKGFNVLVMDVQGFEGEVLKGATKTLKHMDCIYTEINNGFTYAGNMLVDEMEDFLRPFGFVLKEQYWPSANWTWGDGFFIKEKK